MILHIHNCPEEEITMSIGFEKTFAPQAPAETRLACSDRTILLIAALVLLAMIFGFLSLLPVAPGGDIAASLQLFAP